MFKNYLTVAVRNLLRHKIYSAINITGLAIGLASCMVISFWVYYHLSFDSFNHNADRICRIWLNVNFKGQSPIDYCGSFGLMGPDLARDYPEVTDYTRVFKWNDQVLIRQGDRRTTVLILCYSESSLFDLFSFEFVAGNPKTALSAPGSLVLTEKTARSLFGSENPLGRIVELNGEPNYKVTGVLKNLPRTSHLQFDMLASFKSEWQTGWLGSYKSGADFYTYLELSPGADLKELERKTSDFFQKYAPDYVGNLTIHFQTLRDIHLKSKHLSYDLNWGKMDISYVYIFSAVAVLILLVACINFINLSTARSAGRTKEVAIRKVMGAHRSQLIMQFFGEMVLVCAAAMLLAYSVQELILPVLGNFFGQQLDFGYPDALVLIGVTAGLILIVGLTAGWYPSLLLSSPQPHDVLKAGGRMSAKGCGLRRLLLIFQFSVSIILIVGSIFIWKQLQWIQNRNLGFNKDNIVVLKMPEAIRAKYKEVSQELLENPLITGTTAFGPHKLGNLLRGMNFNFEGKTPDQQWLTNCMAVDPGFVNFFGLEIVEGRNFTDDKSNEAKSAYLINETLKKQLGWGTAVGKKFWLEEDKQPGEVIGVVRDFNYYSLHQRIEPLALFIRPGLFSIISVRIRPEDVSATLESLEEKWAKYDPSSPFEYSFLDDDFNTLYQPDYVIKKIIGAFALLAIIISCLGLLGLISFSAESRTKEIGIRKVLGASTADIILLLFREFLVLLGVSILIAWPVAWYFTDKWLENFAYRIDLDWYTFVLAGVIALIIAALTVGFQAVKAATANPVETLRYE